MNFGDMDQSGFKTVKKTWPTCNIPEVTKEILETGSGAHLFESETKGPKTFYETFNLAGESIKEVRVENKEKSTPFGMDENKILLPSSTFRRFIGKSRKEKAQTGEPKAIEIKKAKIIWIKLIQKTNFPEAFKDTSGVVKKRITKINLGFNFMKMDY